MSSKVHKFFWKGKRVSEKVYKKRQKQVQIANKLKSAIGKFSSPNLKSLDPQHANTQDKVSCEKKNCDVPCTTTSAPNVTDNNEYLIEGRRVIHVRTLGEHMFCLHCKSILSLTDIQDEKPRGLASIFIVKCRSCEKLNQVFTDKFHKVSEHSYHFDSNTKAALGTVNGGLGFSHINKLLTTLDIREMNWSTYRSHEKEVCNGLEETAQEACIAAALEERKLTIEHADQLKEFSENIFKTITQQMIPKYHCLFDYPRLMNAIEKVYLKQYVQSVVTGFCDTLPIIKKKTRKTNEGANKLENLAVELKIDSNNAHYALYDVIMLQEIITKMGFSDNDLRNTMFSWTKAENKINFTNNLPNALKKLELLKDCVSYNIRKKWFSQISHLI